MQEKRTACRYRVSLPALLCWVDGEKHTCVGFTRDISAKGAFVLCNQRVPAKAVVEIEILLPTSGEVPKTAVRATVHVVRHAEMGLAVEGQFAQPDFPDKFAAPIPQ